MKDSGRANRQSCTTWSRQAGPVRLPQSAAPVRRVLSLIPAKYDDMPTGAQGFYNVKPIVADGGQVALYAPHIRDIATTHPAIAQIGCHAGTTASSSETASRTCTEATSPTPHTCVAQEPTTRSTANANGSRSPGHRHPEDVTRAINLD